MITATIRLIAWATLIGIILWTIINQVFVPRYMVSAFIAFLFTGFTFHINGEIR